MITIYSQIMMFMYRYVRSGLLETCFTVLFACVIVTIHITYALKRWEYWALERGYTMGLYALW